MGMQIESGGHTSANAVVSDGGRLYTSTVANSTLATTSKEGVAYCITTDSITLTTIDTWYGVLYIKNTSSEELFISSIIPTASNNIRMRPRKNPTQGSLITGGTPHTPINLNFASGRPFGGDVLVGSDGDTVTDGTTMGTTSVQANTTLDYDFQGAIILSRNTSLAVEIYNMTNPTDVFVNILAYFNGGN